MNFKQLWEKKRQIEQSLKIWKAIENLIIHSSNWICECNINYQFVVSDFKIHSDFKFIPIKDCWKIIEDCVNKAISKMQEEIMFRTKEILSSPKWL